MKKKASKKPVKKVTPKKKFKKPEDDHKDWSIREEEKWEKDGLDEEENSVPVDHIDVDEEDEWIETESGPEDDEEAKIIDDDFLEDEDKDNY